MESSLTNSSAVHLANTSDSAIDVKPLMKRKSKDSFAEDLLKVQKRPADNEDLKLSELLGKVQYEPLKDQLANLAAAKESGNFVYQVAASISSLLKCSGTVTAESLSEFDQQKEWTMKQVNQTYDQLKQELGYIMDDHEKKMETKLETLSAVLDEIKTIEEELAKYRQLLTSLSGNITTEK